MGELGTWLRETREAKALSLEEVEAQTRIRQSFLQALEEGNYQVLPGEVYVRGFLRNYALHLRLDPEEVLWRYSQEMPSQRLKRGAQSGSGFRPIEAALERPRRPISTLVTRIVLILLLVVGVPSVGVWYWYGCPLPQSPAWWRRGMDALLGIAPPLQTPTSVPTRTPTSPLPTVTPMPSLPAATPNSAPAAATLGPAPPTATLTPVPATATPTPVLPTETPPSTIVATSAVLPLPTPTRVPTATSTPTSTPPPAAFEDQGIELRAQVIERAWVLITVDGEVDFQGILERDEERVWQAEHSMGFRCGNAGGVLITINGEELGALGERGQVVDRTWIVQEEQTITSTPPSP